MAGALRGVLILAADGKELAASGIAAQRELATRIVSGWRDARRREQRVFAVEGPDGSAVVVVVPANARRDRAGRDAARGP